LTWITIVATFGPLPVDDAIGQINEVRADADASSRVHAQALVSTGFLLALRGQFDDARSLAAEGRSMLRELGLDLDWAAVSHLTGSIELLANNAPGAEHELRTAYDVLEQHGEKAYLSGVAGYLAEAVRRQGRLDEALRLSDTTRALSAPDDLTSQALWRTARAGVLAAQGTHEEAERLAVESVTLLEPTDSLHDRAETLLCLAEVHSLAGRTAGAIRALEQANQLATLKGDTITARKAQARRKQTLEHA
jgi:tetratricopeptide (TPR) repeat protein